MQVEKIPYKTKSKRKIKQDEIQHWKKNSGKRGAKGLSRKIIHEYNLVHNN